MARDVHFGLRSSLLGSTSGIGLAKARTILLPIVAGAAMAVSGVALTPSPALAADVSCSPNPSGAPLTLPSTNCVGAGDGVNFPSATVNSTVTLESLNISGGAAYGVTIDSSGFDINVADSVAGGSITSTVNAIGVTAGGGNISVNLTNTATGISASGSNGGIFLNTGGNGTIGLSTIANVSGGGIGIDTIAVDGNTTLNVRNVSGVAAGIQNGTAGAGNVNTTVSGNVFGDFVGIRQDASGTGNLTLTVNSGASVAASSPWNDIIMTTTSSNITLNMNGNSTAGGVLTSAGGTGNLTVNSSGNIVSTVYSGLIANTVSGNITINQTAGNITGNGPLGNGTQAISTSGNISITANGRVAGTTLLGNTSGINGNTSANIAVAVGATGNVSGANYGVLTVTSGATGNVTVLSTGNVSAQTLMGIGAYGNSSTGLVTVGTSANRVGGNILGGNASGGYAIDARGLGDVSIYTGNGSVQTSTSTTGGAWTLGARSLGNVAASPGGAVIVDTFGLVTAVPAGRGGIIATSAGLDATDSVTVTTHGATYSFDGTAIDARATNGNVIVDTYATVYGTQGVGTDGGIAGLILLAPGNVAGTGNVTITTHGNNVTGGLGATTPTASDAIVASTFSGTLTINTSAGGNLTGTDDGIEALSTTGAITITAGNTITSGNLASGGPTQLTGSVANGSNGIIATSTSGNIIIGTTGGSISAGAAGIQGTTAGTVSVTNAATSVTGGVVGINAASAGANAVTVMNNMTTTVVGNVTSFNTPSVIATAGNGLTAISLGGNVLVSGTGRDLAGNGTTGDDGLAGTVTATGAPGNGGGILASTNGTGTVTVRLAGANAGNATVLANPRGSITVNTANANFGIKATTVDGNVTVTGVDSSSAGASITLNAASTGNVTTGSSNTGISAVSVGGNVSVATGNNNNLVIQGDNSMGIFAQSNTGNVTVGTGTGSAITITANGSGTNEDVSGFGSTTGILARQTAGSGSVNVTTGGAITVSNNAAGNTTGILASNAGTGNVSVTAGGNVTSNGGSAVRASSTTGNLTITNAAILRGLGTSVGTAVVNVQTAAVGNTSAGAITLNNNGTGLIASTGGLAAELAVAVTAASGPITINNAGRITGRMDLSGASSSVFNNTSLLSWHTSGTTTFTNGDDLLNNASTGLIATSGATTFAFLNGSDGFINAGGLLVGETAGASTLTLTKGSGTLVVTNSRTIVMGSVNGGLTTDGETNDQLFAQGPGMSFVSSGNTSRLVIDAYLGAGAEAQTACTPSSAFADCITIGASSGTGTRVTVIDANNAGSGAFNFTGTVVVDATSGSAGDFFLSPSDSNVVNTPQGPAIVKGFVQYQLLFDSANTNWDLVGLPSAQAIELTTLTGGLQNLWYETAGSWNERTSLLRYDFANDRTAHGWSVWGKGSYGRIDRDSTNGVSVLGSTVFYDTSYGQNYYGFQIGADYFSRTGNNGAWMFGVLGGYNKSTLEFNANTDEVDISVYNGGGYISYLRGPVFADLMVKDDIAKFDFKLPALAALNDIDANSIGGELTLGARFGGTANMGLVIEPLATLAYVNTTIDTMDFMGMNFAWEDGTSFRGTFAVRLSGDLRGSETTLQPFILGGVGQEFNGNNKLTVTSGDSLVLSDKPIKTFGVASLGLNAFSAGGLSGYIRGDGMYGSHYTSLAARVGIRYTFGATP